MIASAKRVFVVGAEPTFAVRPSKSGSPPPVIEANFEFCDCALFAGHWVRPYEGGGIQMPGGYSARDGYGPRRFHCAIAADRLGSAERCRIPAMA